VHDVVLILALATAAIAAPAVHASVSLGAQGVLGTRGTVRSGPVARAELGVGPERIQGYAVLQGSTHNAPDAYEQLSAGRLLTVGDLRLTDVGLGARAPIPIGPGWLSPHVDLGMQSCDSPINAAFYENVVLPDLGTPPVIGPHERGAWGQAGLDLGVDLRAREAGLFFGADVGMSSLRGLGPTLAARLGAAVRF